MTQSDNGREAFPAQEITVRMEPSGSEFTMPRVKTALQLHKKLGIKPGTALVILEERSGQEERDGSNRELLTPDREILPGDRITVRTVVSRG